MLGFGIFVFVISIATAIIFFRKLPQRVVTGEDFVWAAHFDASRYRALERLLEISAEDRRWLKSQPGFERRIWKTLSANRRKAIQLFLSQIEEDFCRLHGVALLKTLHAPTDESLALRELTAMRNRFWLQLRLLYLRVTFSPFSLGTANIAPLLKPLTVLAKGVHVITEPAAICEPSV